MWMCRLRLSSVSFDGTEGWQQRRIFTRRLFLAGWDRTVASLSNMDPIWTCCFRWDSLSRERKCHIDLITFLKSSLYKWRKGFVPQGESVGCLNTLLNLIKLSLRWTTLISGRYKVTNLKTVVILHCQWFLICDLFKKYFELLVIQNTDVLLLPLSASHKRKSASYFFGNCVKKPTERCKLEDCV